MAASTATLHSGGRLLPAPAGRFIVGNGTPCGVFAAGLLVAPVGNTVAHSAGPMPRQTMQSKWNHNAARRFKWHPHSAGRLFGRQIDLQALYVHFSPQPELPHWR